MAWARLHLRHGQVLGMVQQAVAMAEALLQLWQMGQVPSPSRLGPAQVTRCPLWKLTALLALQWPRPGESLQETTVVVVQTLALALPQEAAFLPAQAEVA